MVDRRSSNERVTLLFLLVVSVTVALLSLIDVEDTYSRSGGSSRDDLCCPSVACIHQIQEKRVVARVKREAEGKMLVKLVCRYAGLSFIGLSFFANVAVAQDEITNGGTVTNKEPFPVSFQEAEEEVRTSIDRKSHTPQHTHLVHW